MPGFSVRIVAADSMGVRSLATFVEACGVPIAVDLGASIAPRRFSLPPHPIELERLERALEEARRLLAESLVAIVTHYHYDHYLRWDPELYYGRMLLVKDIRRDINRSQAIRGYRFLVKGGVRDRASVEFADSRSFEVESGVRIDFSPPVWHGEPGTKLGKVLMTRISCEEGIVVFASDVQGPGSREALSYLEEWSQPRPDLLVISGPPTYLGGYRVRSGSIDEGLRNLEALVGRVKPRVLVADHHLVRDPSYTRVIEKLRSVGSPLGVSVVTAAEFMGLPVEPLESMRRELWREAGEG